MLRNSALLAAVAAALYLCACGVTTGTSIDTQATPALSLTSATPTNTPEEALRDYYRASTSLTLVSQRACCPERALEGELIYAVTLNSSIDTGAYRIGENGRFVRLWVKDGRWQVHLVAVEPNPPPPYTPRRPTPIIVR